MKITLRMRTPLWTGGVDGKSNRVQETGVLGSLRWWYEAIVRGLGGYVGSPASDNPQKRCEFDTNAYQKARRAGHPKEEALAAGLKSLGAVEYLFGATGWARLFRLRSLNAPRTSLHFRTTTEINKNWLGRIFGGKEEQNYSIDHLDVIYGNLDFDVAYRRYDKKYVQSQLALLLKFITAYGHLGARPQHGFGHIERLWLPDEMAQETIQDGIETLRSRLEENAWRTEGPTVATAYNLHNFFHQTYWLADSVMHRFKTTKTHYGHPDKQEEDAYLPCAFDLRYRGEGGLGLRRWLKEEKGWKESDSPQELGPLDKLMGPRSQWKNRHGRYVNIDDELRTASRVYFSMATRAENGYKVVVSGFAPPEVIAVDELMELCEEYMQVLDASPTQKILGRELLASDATGGKTA